MADLDLTEAIELATAILRDYQGRMPYSALGTAVAQRIAPSIEAKVRAQIAADIEAAQAAAWTEGRERTALAFRRAVRIARGES